MDATEERPDTIRLSLVDVTETRPEVVLLSLADATDIRPDRFSFPPFKAIVLATEVVFPFVPLLPSEEDGASFAFPPTRAKEARLPLGTIEGA